MTTGPDDVPYPNPLDSVSAPTTQWTRNNVGEAFPGVVTPLHYDFVVRAASSASAARTPSAGRSPRTKPVSPTSPTSA